MAYSDDLNKASRINLPWDKLDGCNILVTGATGLIGSCLVDVLMLHPNKKYNVYASGRNKERALSLFAKYKDDEAFHFFVYDVTNTLECNINFHYIIHAASNASPNFFSSKPVEIIKSNIEGVINLINYGLKHDLRRFLYVSSGEVYGEGDGRIFTEDYSGYVDPTLSRSCYPSSKRTAETLCAAYREEYGVDTVIARPTHVYGPHFTESDNRVYAQFIRNVVNEENIIMKSTGSQYRSWCYVVDCITALIFILLKGEKGQAYNIADNSSKISIKELAETIARLSNRKVIQQEPSNIEKAGYNIVTKSIFSTDKIEKLGWKIEGSFTEKMTSTIEECKMT